MNQVWSRLPCWAGWVGTCLAVGGCGDSLRGPAAIELNGVRNLSRDGDIHVCGTLTQDGYRALKSRGVKTVIDLRQEHQKSPEQEAEIMAMGLRYVPLPMSSKAIPDDTAQEFLHAMTKFNRGPVLIQCSGANRAGAMYGLYAGSHGNQSTETAVQWAQQAGMRSEGLKRDLEALLAGSDE